MCHQISIKIGINLACILFYKFFFFHLCLYRVHSVGVYTNMPNGGCAAGIPSSKMATLEWMAYERVYMSPPHVRLVRRSGTEPVAHFVWRNGPPADNRI
jgi:hypothetical protein